MNIDVRTLVFILGITHIIQVIAFYHQYRTNKSIQGVGWWLLWSLAEVGGFTATLFRGIPSLFSIVIVLQNGLILLGTIFLYVGVLRFLEQKVNHRMLIGAFSAYIAVLLFFRLVVDNIYIRSIVINAALVLVSVLTAYSLITYKTQSIARTAHFNALIFLVHGSIFMYRTIMIIFGAPLNDLFAPTLFNYLPFLDALIVALLWTFGFIIMVNQRLQSDMTEAKNHFEMVFNTSPDAAVITNIDDGYIFDVNEGFTSITGYQRHESVGHSSIEVNLWKDPAERDIVVKELQEKGYCNNHEAVFRRKDGSDIVGLISAKIIPLKEHPRIFSVIRDITERKRVEERLLTATKEREHLIEELQTSLDNVKTLQGLIPICASCKKVRDDKGFWNQLEQYITEHTDATLSHGICPDCGKKLYGDMYDLAMQQKEQNPD